MSLDESSYAYQAINRGKVQVHFSSATHRIMVKIFYISVCVALQEEMRSVNETLNMYQS